VLRSGHAFSPQGWLWVLKGYRGGATGVVALGERFGSGVLGWREQVGQAYPSVELAADFVPEVVDAFRAVLCGSMWTRKGRWPSSGRAPGTGFWPME
jgi:hypothetical protein